MSLPQEQCGKLRTCHCRSGASQVEGTCHCDRTINEGKPRAYQEWMTMTRYGQAGSLLRPRETTGSHVKISPLPFPDIYHMQTTKPGRPLSRFPHWFRPSSSPHQVSRRRYDHLRHTDFIGDRSHLHRFGSPYCSAPVGSPPQTWREWRQASF